MSNLTTIPIPQQDNNVSIRLADIAKRLEDFADLRQDLLSQIRDLNEQLEAVYHDAKVLEDLAHELAPTSRGAAFPVPNDLPEDFTKRELVGFAFHTPHSNRWTPYVDSEYDGGCGASDPEWFGYDQYESAALALEQANAVAAELAQRANNGGAE